MKSSDPLEERVKCLFVWLFLGVVPLFMRPLWEPDEARYAEIPREMLATGDWLAPRLNGVLYFEKPPLQYWLSAGSMKLFGFSAAAAKLPLALASLILLWCVWRLARRLGVSRPAWAVFMTATSMLVFACGSARKRSHARSGPWSPGMPGSVCLPDGSRPGRSWTTPGPPGWCA
jgi:4-amino-4-deoxy-L-arabinose transferase-like glycosyltransferase